MKTVCSQLAELQADRKFLIGLINQQTNAAKAYVRRAQDWRWDDPDPVRKEKNVRAARIVAAITAGDEIAEADINVFDRVSTTLMPFTAAMQPLQKARDDTERVMIRAARDLPVAPWVKNVPGFGEKALAIIIGETGDLANYDSVANVWKRLGLAPFTNGDGVTKACSTWRRFGGLTKEEWTGDDGPGYSPRRRAEVYSALSDPLFRIQSTRKGPYRAVYDKRRARTAETHPDWSLMQSHMDGLRIMTKYVISDLWSEWRRANIALAEKPIVQMSSAKPEHRPSA